jgi:hypothetical protein
MYQSGAGTDLTRGAAGVAADLNNFAVQDARQAAADESARRWNQEQLDRQSRGVGTAIAVDQMIQLGMQQAEATVADQLAAAEEDAAAARAGRVANKIRLSEMQNPNSTAAVLQKGAQLRRLIAQDPMNADIIMSQFNASSGKGILEQLQGIVSSPEEQRQKILEEYRKDGRQQGLVPEAMSDGELIARVSANNSRILAGKIAEADTQQLRKQDLLSERDFVTNTRTAIAPGKATALQGFMVGLIGRYGAMPENMTPEQRTSALMEFDTQVQNDLQSMRESQPPTVSKEKFENAIATYRETVAMQRDYLSGKVSKEQYEVGKSLTESKAYRQVHETYPWLADAEARQAAINLVGDQATKDGLSADLANKVEPLYALMIAEQDGTVTADIIRRDLNTAETPQEKLEVVKNYKDSLSILANGANTTPDQYLGVISQLWRDYKPGSGNPEYTRMLDSMIETMARPESLRLISAGKNQDKFIGVQEGLNAHLEDLSRYVQTQVRDKLNELQMVNPGFTDPVTGEPTRLTDFVQSMDAWLEPQYQENGAVRYTVKDTVPEQYRNAAREAASAANKVGSRLPDIIAIEEALGNTRLGDQVIPKSEVAREFMESGRWPLSNQAGRERIRERLTGKTPEQQRAAERPSQFNLPDFKFTFLNDV